jgi:uncharacterized OB-fold protein
METLDTITAEQWRAMSPKERDDFIGYWHKQGKVSFRCLNCGYPATHGRSFCEACRD